MVTNLQIIKKTFTEWYDRDTNEEEMKTYERMLSIAFEFSCNQNFQIWNEKKHSQVENKHNNYDDKYLQNLKV